MGATPWWAPAPFVDQSPLANEPSSSTGPGLIDLSPKGTPIASQLVQNPAITAPDGGTTSFFGQGGIDTTVPAEQLVQLRPPGSTEPDELLRHLPGGAQRGGRGGLDAPGGPDPQPRADPPGHGDDGHADERHAGGHLERAIGLRPGQRRRRDQLDRTAHPRPLDRRGEFDGHHAGRRHPVQR